MLPLILAIAIALLLALLLYWLLVTTEGVFLGRRMVVWLYDLTAGSYDRIKAFDSEWEQSFVARPLLRRLAGVPAPLILDVATGTGRLPRALLAEPTFNGRVAGLDASRKMLDHAARKLAPYGGRAGLVLASAGRLPFGSACFHAVTCLEALEFLPSDEAALREMARVLRPGGTLLTTRRAGREARVFLGRYRSRDNLCAVLASLGLERIIIQAWQMDYDLVLARKRET